MKSKNYSENIIKVFKKDGFVYQNQILSIQIILSKDLERILGR